MTSAGLSKHRADSIDGATRLLVRKRGESHLRETAAGDEWLLGDQNLDPRQRYCGSELILGDDVPFRFRVEFDGYNLAEPFDALYLPGGATTGSPYPILRQDLETSGGRQVRNALDLVAMGGRRTFQVGRPE